jgi:hypothetical protein
MAETNSYNLLQICFILDESNVMESSFLERMNTLLANGEVGGFRFRLFSILPNQSFDFHVLFGMETIKYLMELYSFYYKGTTEISRI